MSPDAAQSGVLDGRMPILPEERTFVSFGPFLWTSTVLGSAIWVFLIGAALAMIGDIRAAIPGMLIGLVLGMLPPILCGFPSFRYGVDATDASKAVFGPRGTWITLLGLLYVVCVWQGVVTAFIAKGAATILAHSTGNDVKRSFAIFIGLGVVASAWAITVKGPALLERVNNIVAPVLLLLALIMLILLANRVGLRSLWTGPSAPDARMNLDSHLTLVTAIELGIGVSLGNWPFMGGLLRLVRYRRHIVAAPMLGMGLIGLGFGAAVSALMAVSLSTRDPVMWILDLGGSYLGTAMATATLVGNVAVVGLLSYFAAIAIQHLKLIGRLTWRTILALTLVPSVIATFNIEATLSSVIAFANYQGMLMVGIASVSSGDYFILRRQHLDASQLFVPGAEGRYWFWRGFNWIAVAAVCVSAAIYRMLYDPSTLVGASAFRYLGASIPAYLAGVVVYVLATVVAQRCTAVGGYHDFKPSMPAEVGL